MGANAGRVAVPGIHPSSATLEKVVSKHGDHVYRVACQLTRSTADAEDVVQEAFLTLYTHWLKASTCSNLSAWLTRVATNASIDLLRARKSRGRNVGDGALALLPGSGESPGRRIECRETAAKLEEALAELPPRQMAALILFDSQGLRAKEIGKILGVREVTVRSYVFEARRRVKEALTPYFKGSRP